MIRLVYRHVLLLASSLVLALLQARRQDRLIGSRRTYRRKRIESFRHGRQLRTSDVCSPARRA